MFDPFQTFGAEIRNLLLLIFWRNWLLKGSTILVSS
jgi:hypothetical protein